MIFEKGLLSHEHVHTKDKEVLENIQQGYTLFRNWLRSTILCTTLISYRAVPPENVSDTQIFCMLRVTYLYAALLSVHKQTYVYARQALNHSINMCYASA